MKHRKFEIKFNDSFIETLYALSLNDVIIKAMALAVVQGLDTRIEKITDDEGKVFTNVKINITYEK